MTSVTTYRLVVNTDKYAGNFEREMTAAATGVLGECEVGENQLEDFFDAAAAMGYEVGDPIFGTSPFENLMEQRADDNGCYRPCSIAQVDGAYTAVEMYMFRRPSNADMAFIVQRIRAFAETQDITIKSIEFVKRVTNVRDQVVEALT